MSLPPQVEAFWQAYLATRQDGSLPRLCSEPIWQFGDTPEAETRVGHLVRTGIKTATSELLWEAEYEGAQPIEAGELAIVADGAGEPLCVIEVTEVAIRPFNEVDAQFAFDYGEYGRTLAQWRAETWAFFAPGCAEIGRKPSETMPMLCYRFRVLYPKP